MKKIMISLSSFIVAVLIIGTYMYEKQDPISLPEIPEPKDTTDFDQEEETLQPVTDETVSYTLEGEELHITYNEGDDWIQVPIDKDLLFQGEYQGNETELIEDSYILSEDIVAFLYAEETNEEQIYKILLSYSRDQGKTWEDSVITDSFSPMRFRKVDFLDDQFGYVILSGGRTMSQEYSIVYVTHDGGKSWQATEEPPTTRMLAFGSFVDEETGFLSYGTINPEEPEVYVTQNGGDSWEQAVFKIPEEFEDVFVQAEEPVKEDGHLSVLVNQGPNGDYEGGMVKGKFISEDNGLTWEFDEEVESNEEQE